MSTKGTATVIYPSQTEEDVQPCVKAADVAAPAPTPAELLKKSMELYDEIKKDLRATVSDDDDDADDTPVDPADDYSVTEYVVTVRLTADCASEAADAFSDWVPVCIMNLKSSNRADTRQLLPQAHLHRDSSAGGSSGGDMERGEPVRCRPPSAVGKEVPSSPGPVLHRASPVRRLAPRARRSSRRAASR